MYWVVPEKIRTSPTEEMENDPPSLRTSQDNRTSPLPGQQSPKLYGIGYFKRFNKSCQRQSNLLNFCNFDKLSATSLGASAPQHFFASSCSNTAAQQHSIKGQPNEGQSLKSKQTFCFEAEQYYFNLRFLLPACPVYAHIIL